MAIIRDIAELREAVRGRLLEEENVRAVARETGISNTNLVNFKLGRRALKFENVDKLATRYGIKYNLKNY